MKKFLLVFVLLVIIILSSGYSLMKISAHGSENNYFNRRIRIQISQYPMMRKILSLHYDGDARADYLGKKNDSILVKVIPMEGLYISDKIMEDFVSKIQETIEKPTHYQYSGEQLEYRQFSDFKDLSFQLDDVRRGDVSREAVLYLFIANNRQDDPNQIGSTLQENGIVLFEGDLLANSGGKMEMFSRNIVGTLMHEFGHQIGLRHNEYFDCLMNPVQEFDGREKLNDVTVDFCDWEKNAIQIEKDKLLN
ncbi:MAG: hypothetical protein Athens071425_236 [Parcubacteria group bacterium Athens0714_25]|nr:MAG: hypothetical protein Athens071425_236 [Parcubacteria group bacterium Athens0714_25]